MKSILVLLVVTVVSILKAQQSYDITFGHEGKTVYGTFTVPNGTGSFPTIIINPGTGANDRDGTIPMIGANVSCLYPGLLNDTLKPYKQLTKAIVDSGYAVLRYDKLEYTYQTPATLGAITFHKLWLPVESAINYVKTRNDVDTNRIILIGHSEGAALIPFIAKNRSDISALISIAGPRAPLDSLLAYQLIDITQRCGGSMAQAQAQANQVLNYFNIIRTGNWNASTPDMFGAPPGTWEDYIHAVDSVAINYNLSGLPTLFIGMESDINVPSSELTRFQNEIYITNDFWSIPGLNHYMTPNNDPYVSTTLTDTMIYWLRQQVMATEVGATVQPDNFIQIYPNPINQDAILEYTLNNEEFIFIDLLNTQGIVLQTYLNGETQRAGKHNQVLTIPVELAVGFYFIRLTLSDKRPFYLKVIKD